MQGTKPPVMIPAIRPEAKQYGPYQLRDVVLTRVKKPGRWPLVDMLNLESVTALWKVHSAFKN